MSQSVNGASRGALGCEQKRNIGERIEEVASTKSIPGLGSLLIDLCAAFASTNGVKSDFYFAAGQALVAAEMVAIDEKNGVLLHGEALMLRGLCPTGSADSLTR